MKQSKEVKGTVKVNKTNLYNLVKAKSPFSLPNMRYTHYEHYRSMHYLTYTSKGSIYVQCSFGSSYGAFLLRVEAFGYDEVFELSFDDLLSFGLVKEVSQDTNDIEENTTEQEQPAEDAEEPAEENKQEFKVFEMPLSVFQLIQNQVNDYIDKNDIKYGNKDIPCGVRVELMHNIVEASYRCEIYDAFDGLDDEVVKSILNIEPLSPLERTVFEEIENCFERYNEYAELARTAEYGAEYNGESAEEISRYGHLANEQIFNSDYLKELISKAGLDERYQAWLKVLREREQNEISDIEAEENDI